MDGRGVIYISRAYVIYRSEDRGISWQLDCFIPAVAWKGAIARFRYSARLLRFYVAAVRVLSDGTRVVIARDGIYRASPGDVRLERVFAIVRGSRPLNLGVDNQDRVLFGEYGGNPRRHEVFIYGSEDRGRSFHVVYEFKPSEIRHVHNIIYDPFLDKYWVLVGDFDHETGIGLLDKDLSSLEWVARGNQKVRAVSAIVEEDCLLYGTDSELQPNHIVRLDKRTRELVELCSVEGTSLYATRFGLVRVISTCVEPSRVNRSRYSTLYASEDGLHWCALKSYRKDCLPFVLFQLGTLVLPYSDCDGSIGVYSGQAVTGLDNHVCVVSFGSSAEAVSATPSHAPDGPA